MGTFDFDTGGFVRIIAFVITCLLIYLTRPEGFTQWLSFLLVRIRLILHRRRKRKKTRFPPFNLHSKNAPLCEIGFLPHPKEYEQENQQMTLKDQCCDGVHFIAVDAEQNFLDVAICHIDDEVTNMWIVLKLSDGCCYELPNQPDTRHFYVSSNSGFTAGGLQIRCYSPLRRWRISYNGLLRKKSNSNDGAQDELVHVKFSFIWMGATLIHDLATDYDLSELAKAIARENPHANEKNFTEFEKINNIYEQWGQLMGTLTEHGKSEKELYLWSVRIRHLENPSWGSNLNFAKIFLYFKDGTPLKVEFMSLDGLLSSFFNGYTITAGGKEMNMTNCNLQQQQLSSSRLSSKICFSFREETTTHNVSINATDCVFNLLMGHCNERTLNCHYVKARLDDEEDGYGVIIRGFKSTVKPHSSFERPVAILKEKSYLPNKTDRVVSFENELCKNSAVSGGKGCSLALLADLSKISSLFRVPQGFVITTAAFEEHIERNAQLAEAVKKLANFSSDGKADLKEECEKCSKAFELTELSETLRSEIAAAISNLKLRDDAKFAVRSSAVGEDGEDSSAAGQMVTILGVKGIDKICRAVVTCWSSRFRYEAVQYGRQRGQLPDTSMAVVVQEMVLADSAGVMFTVDPVTGNPMYPCITANFGLGETVVSSAVDPDTYTLKRTADGSITLHDTKIGSKESKIIVLDDGGTEEAHIDTGLETACLTETMVVEIGKAGILVEKCFCGPRDIEWAVCGKDIYLLQARPITTIHTETDFEVTHDLDTPIRSSYEYWTRANTGEVFCGACSPLGISLVVLGMDVFGQRSFIMRQKPKQFRFVPYFCHWLPSSHRQVMLSIIDTLFRANEKKITTAQKAMEIALFGRMIITEDIHRWGVKKFGLISNTEKIFSRLVLIYFSFIVRSRIEAVRKRVWDIRVPLDSYTTPEQVYNSIQEQMIIYGEVSGIHGLATYISSFYNVLMLTLLARGKEVWDNELYSDFATLLSTCNDVESADVPSSLQNLAKAIYETDPITFASVPVEVAHTLLENDKGPAGQKFKEFLEKHGHRCLKEFDVYSVSWGMKPQKLVQVLQSMVASPAILSKVKQNTSTDEAIEKLKSPLSRSSKLLLKVLLPWSRRAVGHREKTKSIIIKIVDWVRRSCTRLSEMLVRDGYLPNSELLFFLTFDEIKLLMETRNMNLISRATRRCRIHPKLNSLKFPEIIVGIPKPVPEESDDAEQYSPTFELKGTPVCPGVVKARARVVLSLDKASEIKQGEVLVAYSTDIGWSPYFPLLSGVITVLGGLISHGAVVAREYGLPCVVGVQKATSLIKTGDLIILDGSLGKITKIDESADQKL